MTILNYVSVRFLQQLLLGNFKFRIYPQMFAAHIDRRDVTAITARLIILACHGSILAHRTKRGFFLVQDFAWVCFYRGLF